MFTRLIHHLKRNARPFAPFHQGGARPPVQWQGNGLAATGWRAGVREWLSTSWHAPKTQQSNQAAAAGSDQLARVRDDFLRTLEDVRTQRSGMLMERIRISRTLRDLWHLRPEIFGLVALRYSQAEAQARLDHLNRYFPTRAPRSGFAPLDNLSASDPRAPVQRR